jgi:hypothetical protein
MRLVFSAHPYIGDFCLSGFEIKFLGDILYEVIEKPAG